MREIRENAYAKLNLSLDVISKLPDGYHELCMVMQSVALHDELHIRLRDDCQIRLSVNLPFLPCDNRNIAAKAAKAFFEKTGFKGGCDIDIIKNIPVCAGMGGGSADGAAVLRGLNKLLGNPLSQTELLELSFTLGSDLPFCIGGGTALAKGKGEVLSHLSPLPHCKIVICKPSFSVSTPVLFSKIDSRAIKYRPDTAGILSCIEKRDLPGICRRMYNVFEEVLPETPKDVTIIKRTLLDCGALGAVMTGTGSAVFGVFDEAEKAEKARLLLLKSYDEVFLTEPQGAISI
jgi:4-diphosphocytidyl-2-C-methyl-D-erythritol kinase